MNDIHPIRHHFVGVLVCGEFGLAVHYTFEFDAGDGLVDCFEGDAECALRHAGMRVFGWAEEIALREVDGDALGNGVFGAGAEDTVFGLEKVHDDLHVGGVVSGVGEDEYGVDLYFTEVARGGGCALLGGEEFLQRGECRLCSDDIIGYDDVFKAILFGYFAALVVFSANNEDSLVVFCESRHWRV